MIEQLDKIYKGYRRFEKQQHTNSFQVHMENDQDRSYAGP